MYLNGVAPTIFNLLQMAFSLIGTSQITLLGLGARNLLT